MKPCIAIYGDFQNVRNSPEEIEILNPWFNQHGNILHKKSYAYWRQEKELFEQAIFKAGFKTISVSSREKNAVDNEIIQDCKHDTMTDKSIKIVILITGDKDYLPLVKYLQNLKIKVILIHGTNVSKSLKKAVDIAYNINELINYVNLDKATPEKLDSPAMIPYEEAKKCLIELIKTVQEKGKKATLAVLGRLIKNHPRLAGYKKVSSIAKPDGKIFAKFGKFVAAVIKEGIIQDCNGELILV
ncbi:MAG: NYN domain-containing protein [Planktothrix sp. GU0601_MAG3]|nr:MAG: NYN domain-containing protein [Planktothrix sp. GU0601_MAG3]